MSFRTFLRKVKKISDDGELFTKVVSFDPSITIKTSGIRALQALVIKQIPTLTEKSTLEMLGILNTLVPAVSNDSTTQNVYVHIRRAIAKLNNPNITAKSYSVMKFDQVRWRAARAKYLVDVAAKNNDKRNFNTTIVYSIMDEIKMKETPDFVDYAILLQLACGGRISEILTFASFRPANTSLCGDSHLIIQTGILKSKDRVSITKPIIHLTVATFLQLLNKMRNMLAEVLRDINGGTKTHYSFSQESNNKINRRITKYFSSHGEKEATSHDLRKIYAALAYSLYADKSKKSEAAYLSDVLGHAEGSLNVSASYTTVSVSPSPVSRPVHVDVETVTVPRNLKLRDGRSGERLAETARIMTLKGMEISNKILRTYGYSATTVGDFLKT
jgi:integrase